jgi:MFS superfamily sulfate permease-like transporter
MFSHPREDLVAGTVVFLVAVPLCLGIAVACGVPPVSGLIAGIAGGIVVPFISRSSLSVTGPAAGLTSVVLMEVATLGGLDLFLTAVILAGLLQIVFGAITAGRFAGLVPSAVIKGMLAAIGITIIIKQIPVAFGVVGGLRDIPAQLSRGPVSIAVVSLFILFGWRHLPLARIKWLPSALVVVVLTTLMGIAFASTPLALDAKHFVAVPLGSPSELLAALPRPDLTAFLSPAVWMTAVTLAIVASIETLLSLQAIDRLDPMRRRSPPDRELMAQGAANAVSGFFGGLPVTAVIVRSGANLAAGGRERLSALTHGVLLLVAALFAGAMLNRIPLAALAAVLIQVGLKLCAPALFKTQWRLGMNQFLPFAFTIAAILVTDLLKGVIAGIIIGVFFVLRQNASGAIVDAREPDGTRVLRFRRNGTFISKPALVGMLDTVEHGEKILVDASGEFIDHDVKEVLAEFVNDAPERGVNVRLRGIDLEGVGPSGH